MKAGRKTSEFVIVLATGLGQLLAALVGVLPADWAGGGITAVAVAYALGRSFVKAGGAEALQQFVETPDPQPAAPVAVVPPVA